MADDVESGKARAEQKKKQQAEDGRKAMLDYEAEAAALRAKTEKLRALRLAREAAAPPAPAKSSSAKSAKSTRTTAKTRKAKGQPLSDWLNDQKKDGRD
jgi:hypothetical protein